jgi:Peptidase family C25/Concanavalin A-like lectin/glucanases superfamily
MSRTSGEGARVVESGSRMTGIMRQRGSRRLRGGASALAATAAVCLFVSASGAFGYGFRKSITIDRSKISDASCGSTLSNYPMLFSVTDPDLAKTTSGGHVTDLQGDDIIFVAHDSVTCGGPASCALDHEIEKYVSTTGELVAWVRIPSVNTAAAASNTVVYVYYGDSTVTSPTENPNGVWDSNYVAVWHLKESGNGTVGEFADSTSNANHGQGGAGVAARVPTRITTGKIGNAQTFDNTDDKVQVPNSASLGITGDITVSTWIKRNVVNWAAFLTKTNLSSRYDYQFLVSVSDTLGLWADGESPVVINTTVTFTDTTKWHHLAVTKSGTGVTFYIDGAIAAGGGTQTPASLNNNPDPVVIGYDNESNAAIGGNLDEVRLSHSARSGCWIKASYNNEAWPDKAVTPSPDPSPNPSSGFYTVGAETTAVKLLSFTATGVDGGVELSWETGAELSNLGFHVYRSSSSSGPWERITGSLIPGLGSSPEGARYRYVDTGLENGVLYFYELEDVETTGQTKRHGPVSATPTWGVATGEDSGSGDSVDRGDGTSSGSVITYGEPEANGLSVVKRGRDQVVVELRTEGFVAYPEQDGSVRIEVPDYVDAASGLPVKQSWVEAVAGRQVELVSTREREVEAVGLRPAGASEEAVVASLDGLVRLERRSGRSASRRERARRGRGRGGSSDAARVVEVAFQGEVKKALVEMAPMSWDESRQQIRLAKKLYVTLSFAKRDPNEVVSADGRRGRRERVETKGKGASGGVLARLATVAPGLYAVRYEELFGRGAGRGVSADSLRLSRLGETVSYHLEPSTSRFAPGSTLYFVSPGAEANRYGEEAVFELEYPVSRGARMSVSDASPTGGGSSTGFYLRRDEHEENHIYQAALLEAEDPWLWDVLMAPGTKEYGFEVNALAGVSEPGRLGLWLQGGSDFPVSPDHHVVVRVNGTVVGELSWDGKLPQKLDVELGPGVLREGGNTLEIENVGDTGAAYSMVFLDRYAVTYPRVSKAEEGELEGTWTRSGTGEVSGVSWGASLLDTTEGQPPVWLSGTSWAEGNALRFRAEGEHRYLVVDGERLGHPEVRTASAVRFKSESNRADFVVIGPREFLDAAGPLLEQRRRQGLTPVGVPVEEIYEEFGFGESRPEAIRDFLAYAYHHWKAPSLRYVLLVGDGSYDFKNDYGTGVVNRVPPLVIETSYLWTASDPTYAAVNGDDRLPDVAIGRLPAANVDEVRAMVEKILAYESGGTSPGAPIVVVSDNPDGAGDFDGEAKELAETVLAGDAPRRISLAELGTTATRRAILDAFDEGAYLVSYIGHGGIAVWADENLLDLSGVSSLAPQAQQPLLLTMNCLNGYFDFPFSDSLSEALVKAEDKGAIVAFSPSGLSLSGPAHRYHQALLNELLHGNHQRLGDAVLAAQQDYADTGAFPELLSIYHLLGDPTLLLR